MINNQNQVILFYLHFHKSGGTTINSLFQHYNKHKPNHNGNSWSKSNNCMYTRTI